MSGLFGGLEISKRALLAQQLAMNTTGHNIANAATPGYSRQRIELRATYPLNTPQGNVGTGVMAQSITQVRDLFLNAQFRSENSSLSRWDSTSRALTQVESVFNEPGDKGLNQLLTDFWNSWENLSTNPDTQVAVVETAKGLINGFQEHARQLAQLRDSLDVDIKNGVQQINQISSQIASLNRQIASSELGGDKANDLRDQRDGLIDELSTYVEVRTIDRPNGTASVLMGSMALVDGIKALKLDAIANYNNGSAQTNVVWSGTNVQVDFGSGQLAAMGQLRDKTIPEYQNKLDQLASTIVSEVNAIHRTGVAADGSTNVNFFDPTRVTALTMALNVDVELNPKKVAASLSGEPGDVRNAQAISELRNKKVLDSNTATINEFFTNLVGTIGVRTQEAGNLRDNYDLLVTQLDNARQSVQGVSIDEEVTNMIRYQRAYEASARMVTYFDSSLETIITGMGVTR